MGWPEQVRRYVFAEAGPALQACASRIQEPLSYLKATVEPTHLRQVLPASWQLEAPRYFMHRAGAMRQAISPPAGYATQVGVAQGATVVRLVDATGQLAASGRVVLTRGRAVFDRIETAAAPRRQGLGTAVLSALDTLATQAGATERPLVATEAGRALYLHWGWEVVAPYSTAVLPAA